MDEAPADQQLSLVRYLLRIGFQDQMSIMCMGFALIFLAVLAIIFAKNRTLITLISFFTLIPGIIAVVSIVTDLELFMELATSQVIVKPAEIGSLTGSIAAAGFWGILMTIIPAGLCLAALLKTPSYIDEPPMD